MSRRPWVIWACYRGHSAYACQKQREQMPVGQEAPCLLVQDISWLCVGHLCAGHLCFGHLCVGHLLPAEASCSFNSFLLFNEGNISCEVQPLSPDNTVSCSGPRCRHISISGHSNTNDSELGLAWSQLSCEQSGLCQSISLANGCTENRYRDVSAAC